MTRTKRIGWLSCLALTLALAAAAPVRAAEEAQPQAYAVLVGVSHYADQHLFPRPHAEADVKAVYDVLTNKDYLGAPPAHVRLLLGSVDAKRGAQLATHDNVLKALHWLAGKARRDDLAVFMFVGEGGPLVARSCLFTSDSTFQDRARNAVAAADIEKALEKLQSQKFCAILDVNFKGYDSGKGPGPDLNLTQLFKFEEYFGDSDDEKPPIGRAVLLSTPRGLTRPLDLKDHGLFTTALLEALKGKADKEGYEPDGVVTFDELADYLGNSLSQQAGRVSELARTHGKSKQQKEQNCLIMQGEACHFVLTHNPAAMPQVRERLDKFNQLAGENKLPRDVVEEGRHLLSRMPKLEAYRSLRKRYQQLADGKLAVEDFEKDRQQVLEDMKLKRSDALEFAAQVVHASEQVEEQYVKDVTKGELVGWAIRGLYQHLEMKVPQDIKDRLENVKDMKEDGLTRLLADVRQRLGNREDLAHHRPVHKDTDIALQRMLHHLDPYTTYIDPETLAKFKQDTQAQFTGIGIQIRKDTAQDMLLVVSPIKDSPAYRAGIKAGDVITKVTRLVDSQGNSLDPPETISTKGLPLNDAVKLILGTTGSKVKLTVDREGVDHPLEFKITRGVVNVETVLGVRRKANDSWDYLIDPENRIAYVRLTSFAKNTYHDLDQAMKQLHRQGVKAFILDLRFNPGGLLTSAVQISDLFIDDGLIVTIRPRVGKEQPYVGESEGSYLDFPMVCLVNGQSASASEIVSACLQDHNRAIIVGERSYGKGSVQNIQPFAGGELKLTTARYWRPSNKNIHREPTMKEADEWGVMPDKGYVLKLSRKERLDLEEHMRDQEIIPRRDLPSKEAKPEFKDRQLDQALRYLRDQIKTTGQVQARKAG
jgi:C-terminal peptidase prc